MPYYSAHSDKKINQLCLTRVTPNSLGLTNLPSGSGSNWNLDMLVFEEGKTGVPGEKPLGARTRTNNKLNPHMTPGPRVEPGPTGERQAL